MKGWDKRYRKIREEFIGQTGKRALLVEGPDDEALFRIFLSRGINADWERHWVLVNTNNKEMLTHILAEENKWLGIVDRDEWTDEIIEKKQAELDNLFVLPRFCLESYAIDPNELWTALPPAMQDRVTGGREALSVEILLEKEKWLRHGVLWTKVNPLWSGLRTLGFKERLLDFATAQNDAAIQETLNSWHNYLESDAIFRAFTEKLDHVSQLPEMDQLRKWIHGKQFFLKRVHPVLNRYLGQTDSQTRMKDIFRTTELPDDLDALWSRLLQPM